jgi:hypothetical protein
MCVVLEDLPSDTGFVALKVDAKHRALQVTVHHAPHTAQYLALNANGTATYWTDVHSHGRGENELNASVAAAKISFAELCTNGNKIPRPDEDKMRAALRRFMEPTT